MISQILIHKLTINLGGGHKGIAATSSLTQNQGGVTPKGIAHLVKSIKKFKDKCADFHCAVSRDLKA